MNDQHIASAFDRDLQDIQAQIMKMGGLVEMAILDAAECTCSLAIRRRRTKCAPKTKPSICLKSKSTMMPRS